MININHKSYQKDNNDDDHDNNNRVNERRERRERDEDECERAERRRERVGECCSKKLRAPVVLAPIVAVTGGTTAIGAYPDRVAVQVLNNAALLATYTIVLQSLPKCEEGYIVVETAEGITSISVIGANNVPTSALTTAGSYIILKWIGETWTQV